MTKKTHDSSPEPLRPDLTEFLRARLDEDEQAARQAEQVWPSTHFTVEPGSIVIMRHLRTYEPPRVLAEVEAKRRILGSHYDYHGVCPRCFDWQNKPVEREPWPCEVARLLALPYASHPDYQEQWRPDAD